MRHRRASRPSERRGVVGALISTRVARLSSTPRFVPSRRGVSFRPPECGSFPDRRRRCSALAGDAIADGTWAANLLWHIPGTARAPCRITTRSTRRSPHARDTPNSLMERVYGDASSAQQHAHRRSTTRTSRDRRCPDGRGSDPRAAIQIGSRWARNFTPSRLRLGARPAGVRRIVEAGQDIGQRVRSRG